MNQFDYLVEVIKKYSLNITVEKKKGYAYGIIAGYPFRIFEEKCINGSEAFLAIKDEESTDTKWSAFYYESELDEWYFKKALEGRDVTYCSGAKCPIKHLCGRNIHLYQEDNDVYMFDNIPANFDSEGNFKCCGLFFNRKASIDDAIQLCHS